MFNPNIRKYARNLSIIATAALGVAALNADGERNASKVPKPIKAPAVETIIRPPVTDITEIQALPDGLSMPIYATVAPSEPGKPVRATFSLVHKKELPKGVEISKTKETVTSQGDVVSAQLTAPSDEYLRGDIPVELTVSEPSGSKVSSEEVPYIPTPPQPQ